MGIVTERRLVIQRKTELPGEDAKIENIALLPLKNGQYTVGEATVDLQFGTYNERKKRQKLLIKGDIFKAKKSKDRRVVHFPKDVTKPVTQEINKNEKLIFRRDLCEVEYFYFWFDQWSGLPTPGFDEFHAEAQKEFVPISDPRKNK